MVYWKQAPFTFIKPIKMLIDGIERIFEVKTEYNDIAKHFIYTIPDDFPKPMIKLIFGQDVKEV
jgi:hypothetical protein